MKRWLLRKLGRCGELSPEGYICSKKYEHNKENIMSLHVGWKRDYGRAWGGLFEEKT